MCDHQKLSLQKGDLCGLTNRKPDFNRTCIRIKLNEKLKQILGELHVNLEDQIILKKELRLNLILKPILGFVVVLMGYYMWQYILNQGYIAFIPAIIIAIGIYLIRNPFSQKKAYNNEISLIDYEIKEIKDVLKLYQVSYKAEVIFSKEIHGTKEGIGNIIISK